MPHTVLRPDVPATGRAEASPARPRLLLADDHRALLDSLCELLAPAYDIVGAVGDGESLVQAALDLDPDLILSDIAMPRLNGLEAVTLIRGRAARARIVIYSVDQDRDTAEEALRRGAMGYVTKAAPLSALLDVMRGVLAGTPRIVLQ